jgi:hypothetical protein
MHVSKVGHVNRKLMILLYCYILPQQKAHDITVKPVKYGPPMDEPEVSRLRVLISGWKYLWENHFGTSSVVWILHRLSLFHSFHCTNSLLFCAALKSLWIM